METKVVNLRKEPYDVYIGRGGKWGNPFRIGADGSRDDVIIAYAKWISTQQALLAELPTLKGKVLGCYCKPAACHGDVLVSLIEKS